MWSAPTTAPNYEIVGNQLQITTTGGTANAFSPILSARNLPHDPHYALSDWWDVKLPDDELSRIRIGLGISPPNTSSIDFLEAYLQLEPGAADGSTCGNMRFLYEDLSGNPTQIGDTIQLPGFIAGQWYRVRFCLDWNLSMAIGAVVAIGTPDAEVFGHHVKDIPHVTGTGGSNGPLHTIFSTLWVNRQVNGTYEFDNYKLEALRQETSGYYYYYADNNCPSCKSSFDICEAVTVEFTDNTTDDCRWTPNETGGGCLKAGWSGLDSDGLEDSTVSATLVYHVPEGGGAVTLCLGDFCATVTVDTDGNGTLTLVTAPKSSQRTWTAITLSSSVALRV